MAAFFETLCCCKDEPDVKGIRPSEMKNLRKRNQRIPKSEAHREVKTRTAELSSPTYTSRGKEIRDGAPRTGDFETGPQIPKHEAGRNSADLRSLVASQQDDFQPNFPFNGNGIIEDDYSTYPTANTNPYWDLDKQMQRAEAMNQRIIQASQKINAENIDEVSMRIRTGMRDVGQRGLDLPKGLSWGYPKYQGTQILKDWKPIEKRGSASASTTGSSTQRNINREMKNAAYGFVDTFHSDPLEYKPPVRKSLQSFGTIDTGFII